MPALSKAQAGAAGAALAVKRGEKSKSELFGASKQMLSMSQDELAKFAGTKHKGLPAKKGESLQQIGAAIVTTLLSEDHEDPALEGREVAVARNILAALKRLQSSLTNPSPEQQHALTTIRAAAHSLVRQ
jgi:hypothetical protein